MNKELTIQARQIINTQRNFLLEAIEEVIKETTGKSIKNIELAQIVISIRNILDKYLPLEEETKESEKNEDSKLQPKQLSTQKRLPSYTGKEGC